MRVNCRTRTRSPRQVVNLGILAQWSTVRILQFVCRFEGGGEDGWDYPPHFVVNGTTILGETERQPAAPYFWKFASQIVDLFSALLLPKIVAYDIAMK